MCKRYKKDEKKKKKKEEEKASRTCVRKIPPTPQLKKLNKIK